MGFTAFSKHIFSHNAIKEIHVIWFWTSIASMISINKWQCNHCYCYYYCYDHFYYHNCYHFYYYYHNFHDVPFLWMRRNYVIQLSCRCCQTFIGDLCTNTNFHNAAYVIKTCLSSHGFSGAGYWGYVSPKLHFSMYRNQQNCWWFHNYRRGLSDKVVLAQRTHNAITSLLPQHKVALFRCNNDIICIVYPLRCYKCIWIWKAKSEYTP